MAKPKPKLHPFILTHWPVIMAIAALFIVASGFLATGWHAPKNVEWDWDQYWSTREVVRRMWLAGGQLFPWVAQFCGGFPILDSTEIPIHSPFLALWQWFGTVPGTKLEFVLLLSIGLVGMYRACGALFPRSPNWVRGAAALHFVICGFFMCHLNAGHFSFAEYSLFSWIIYGFVSGRPGPIALALAAGVHFGANNYFMHAIIFTVSAALARWAWIKLMVQSGLLAGALAAPLLVHNALEYPNAKYLRWTAANHHEVPETLDRLVSYFVRANTNIWERPTWDYYWEFGAYIGFIALTLGVVGLIWGSFRDRNVRPWGIVGLIFLTISLGPFSDWAPYRLFWELPLLSRLEVNTRFLLGVTITLFVGWSWLLGQVLQKTSQQRIAAGVLAVLSLTPSLIYAKAMFDQPGEGRLLPDLRGKPADMKEMRTVWDFRIGRYDAVAGQYGLNICHISSSKGKYPGKVQLNRGPLLEAPEGSIARWDDRYWWVEWNPAAGVDRKNLKWLMNQNYNPHFVVDAISSPRVAVNTWTRDHLIGFEIQDPSALTEGKQLFRLRLKTPGPVLAAYGLCLIAWVVFIFRWLNGLQFVTKRATARIGKANKKITRQ